VLIPSYVPGCYIMTSYARHWLRKLSHDAVKVAALDLCETLLRREFDYKISNLGYICYH